MLRPGSFISCFLRNMIGLKKSFIIISLGEQGCHGTWKTWKTWKKGNFLIKSGKTLKSQGKKLKKHRSQGKVGMFLYYLCVSVVCIKLQVLARILGDTVVFCLLVEFTFNAFKKVREFS